MHSLDHVLLFFLFFVLFFFSFNLIYRSMTKFSHPFAVTRCVLFAKFEIWCRIQNPYLHSTVCHSIGALCRHDCFFLIPLSILVYKDASENLRCRNLDFRTSRNRHFLLLKFSVHYEHSMFISGIFYALSLHLHLIDHLGTREETCFFASAVPIPQALKQLQQPVNVFFLRKESEWSKYKG